MFWFSVIRYPVYFPYCLCNLVLLNAIKYGRLPTGLNGCFCLVSFYDTQVFMFFLISDTQVFMYHVYFPYRLCNLVLLNAKK